MFGKDGKTYSDISCTYKEAQAMNKFDKRHLPFGNVFAIADKEVIDFLKSLSVDGIFNESIQETFLNKFRSWILSSKNNNVQGLEKYPYSCFSNGTTESFDKFYAKHNKKRFRFFKGEFAYHRVSCRNYGLTWEYLENDVLRENDVVIVSQPFSDTGSEHKDLKSILDQCDSLNIPVLLDCIYFGVCSGINFDLNRDCITDITFSLSKSLSAAHLRIGMRLTKVDDDDPLFVNNKIGYINRLSAHVGLALIERFGPDYIFNKYRNRQIEYCNILGVQPSSCVMFGIGGEEWEEYNRDRDTNRLSLHRFLSDDHSNEIKEIADGKRKIN